MAILFIVGYFIVENKSEVSSSKFKDTYGNEETSGIKKEGNDNNVSDVSQHINVGGSTDIQQQEVSENNAIQVDRDPRSYTVLVNKEYTIDKDYVPDDLIIPDVKFSFDYADEKRSMRTVPAKALETMFADAKAEGYELLATSGYRSYGRQNMLYNYNLTNKGYDYTNVYSAMPGTSEHQTGLAIDMTCKTLKGVLSVEFGNTPEGKWVGKNCYKYGFVLRYDKSKESITGYGYEPWHFRYVGLELAKYLYDNNLSLDEYYGYTPDFDYIERQQLAYYDGLLSGKNGAKQNGKVSKAELDDIIADLIPTVSPVPTGTTVPTAAPTEAPVQKTQQPTKTPAEATKAPVKTEQPHTEPTVTPEPVVTSEPVVTEAPVETESPVETETPEVVTDGDSTISTDILSHLFEIH